MSVDTIRVGLGVMSAFGGLTKFAVSENAKLWPRLPLWFWIPAGCWEIVTGYLLSSSDTSNLDLGLGLALTFMGGVYSSIFYITDTSGNTHFSGKGVLGGNGRFMVVPATIVTSLYVLISVKSEASSLKPITMVTCGLGGFTWGVFCSSIGGKSKKN